MTLLWAQSPVDLPDEAPLEREFPSAQALDEIGALEASAQRPETQIRPGLSWSCGILAVSTASLILFNAHALGNWADQHPDAPGADMAHQWYDTAQALGLTRPVEAIERAADHLRTKGWP